MLPMPVVLWTIAALAVTCAAQQLPPKLAQERPGLRRANVSGQMLSPSGRSAPGVLVQLIAWGRENMPSYQTTTGDDGRFTLPHVETYAPAAIVWFKPGEWSPGSTAVPDHGSDDIDLGPLQLQPDTIFRVTFELVGGSPLGPDAFGPSVKLVGPSDLDPHAIGETIWGEQILRPGSLERGTWEVRLDTVGASETYRAPFTGTGGRRNRQFTFRLLRDTVRRVNEWTREGRMVVIESEAAPLRVLREYTLAGKVIAPDGSPVAGALISEWGIPLSNRPLHWTWTAANGEFHLPITDTNCYPPSVAFGSADFLPDSFFAATPAPCERLPVRPSEIRLLSSMQLLLQVTGLAPIAVSASWWHAGFGWRPFATLTPTIPGRLLGPLTVRLTAPGYLPLARELNLPFPQPDAAPPAQWPVGFTFDANSRRTLTVRSGGQPVRGARVELEAIVDLRTEQRQFLESYPLPEGGELTLQGGAGERIEAFVYAAGYEPRRAIWNPGEPLEIELSPRDASLWFPTGGPATAARIRLAGSSTPVRTVRLLPDRPTRIAVAPGLFDVTCFAASGQPIGYQRVAVTTGADTRLDCTVDQRPRVTVRLPHSGWRAGLRELDPHLHPQVWSIGFRTSATTEAFDQPAVEQAKSPREFVFQASHAGKFVVDVAPRFPQRRMLFREIDLAPGAHVILNVPGGQGSLNAGLRTYLPDLDRSIHGIAGPRILLLAQSPEQWSVIEDLPLPQPTPGNVARRFLLGTLPAGAYHVHQHLTGLTSTTEGVRRNQPTYAWGGIPVTIPATGTQSLPDFSDFATGSLLVRLTDAQGRPVEHATLRLRDRLWEITRQYPNPTDPSDEIPPPPAVRVQGGQATLPDVRSGQLELIVELDSGRVYHFTVTASLRETLTLVLPAAH